MTIANEIGTHIRSVDTMTETIDEMIDDMIVVDMIVIEMIVDEMIAEYETTVDETIAEMMTDGIDVTAIDTANTVKEKRARVHISIEIK